MSTHFKFGRNRNSTIEVSHDEKTWLPLPNHYVTIDFLNTDDSQIKPPPDHPGFAVALSGWPKRVKTATNRPSQGAIDRVAQVLRDAQ